MELIIEVNGMPAPQGSKKGFPVRRKNGSIGVAITESAGEKVTTWRQDVRSAAAAAAFAQWWKMPAPGVTIAVELCFFLPRPKGHYRTGRNAHMLRDAAPQYPGTKPDLDKLIRAVLDALTSAGIYADDSTVVTLAASKRYADMRAPGASIYLHVAAGDPDAAPTFWGTVAKINPDLKEP